MSALQKPFITPEQYLEIERKAEYKSEYLSGQMFAMAAPSTRHAMITANITSKLREALISSPCVAYLHPVRVLVSAAGLYTYPDVTVIRGASAYQDEHFDTLLNPIVIFEVLSPSTESDDRGMKFAHYRTLKSLTDYIMVTEDKPCVEQYTRQPADKWLLHPVQHLTDSITLDFSQFQAA